MAERPKRIKTRTEAPPTSKRRKRSSPAQSEEGLSTNIQSLPPELVEEILSWVSARDIISFGSTCSTFHLLSLNSILWKKLYQRQASGRLPVDNISNAASTNWKRMAVFKYTQALHIQRLGSSGSGRGNFNWGRGGGQLVSRAVVPPHALGFRRTQPTRDHLLMWDYQGTLFLLRNAVTPSQHGQLTWRRAARYSMLCQQAKDFAVDPRSDISHRMFVYVLVSRSDAIPPPNAAGPSTSTLAPQRCDCVEVYQQDNGVRVFRMTFHASLIFTRIRLTGTEFNRTLLLLTDTGKVYALYVNESQLSTPRSYTVQLSLKKISSSMPGMSIKQLHTGFNSALYLTTEGAAYIEVHTAGVHRQLFGSNAGFDPHDIHVPMPISIPNKVVKCSLSQTHLCLVDDCGRLYMQGCNRYGQLGTGDKIDRGQPTKVALSVSMGLVDVWCGLNHSLALLQGESGTREVHGCGCGAGGRLPGCPVGSAVFVKLSVHAPRSTKSICASKDCLYLLCTHDTEEPPITFPAPAEVKEAEAREVREEQERLRTHLSLMEDCDSMQQQLDLLRDTIQTHMTLSSTHRDFLDQALTTIQHSSSSSSTSMDF
ncbi:F-box only protein 24-like [Alosa sapidissima]|uniref:F-box only protein 24-like n=1 Tax=Alosa sapidissima TaxID=34773 RepID=UPI001C0870D8|nr:F-box only protein 24-like [Alosa sapidissima]